MDGRVVVTGNKNFAFFISISKNTSDRHILVSSRNSNEVKTVLGPLLWY